MKKKYVLILKSVNADMTSANSFKYPEKGPVACKDWKPTAECGHGLHGLLWGEGDYSLLNWKVDAKWLVIKVSEFVKIDNYKVKFPSGNVVYCGDRVGAADYIRAHGNKKLLFSGTATAGYMETATAGYKGTATARYMGTATAGDSGTATAGYMGTATAGYMGTATAGDSGTATAGYMGTATAGYMGTATAGYMGTATAGYKGTATAGDYGAIVLEGWDGEKYVKKCAEVGGKSGLKPKTKYKLNEKLEFEEVKEEVKS